MTPMTPETSELEGPDFAPGGVLPRFGRRTPNNKTNQQHEGPSQTFYIVPSNKKKKELEQIFKKA
jgi:hypothetical protein